MLVTGGAGFIGINFLKHMLQHNRDLKIVNLDKLTYAANVADLPELDHIDNYQFVKGDICDNKLIASLLRENDIDCVVNFAAESHVDRSIDGPLEFTKTNVLGTAALLEEARSHWAHHFEAAPDAFRFHQVSTDEVYGSLAKNDATFTEAHSYKPNSPYSASKAGADHLVRAYSETFGLPVTTTCCSNNYGPYQHGEKLIPVIVKQCLNGHPIPIYGDGSNIRDWLFVNDHCDAIETVIRNGVPGQVYNVGGNNEISNLELAKTICRTLDDLHPLANGKPHSSLISFVTDRPGHDWRYAVNTGKIKQTLNWQPANKFETTIIETLQFFISRAG